MKQIGDYLYTINDIHQIVSIWKIKEFDGNIYRCKNKRTDRIREFAVDAPDIFDTKDAAMEVIKNTKLNKNSIMAIYFLVIAAIAVVFIMFKIFNGTF